MDYRIQIFQSLNIDAVKEEDIVKPASGQADFCLPCFKLSKVYKKSPAAIAEELSATVKVEGFSVSALNGYLNFSLTPERLVSDALIANDSIGANEFTDKVICIDYSSVNIAKPFHIGHLMSTAIGGSLYRIFKFLGAKPVGINHLGDYGTQFGQLITAFQNWGSEQRLAENGLDELLSLYVRFQKEAEKDASLFDRAREWFKRIEDNDAYAQQLLQRFKAITLNEVQKVYDRLGITFDSYNGESFYNDKTAGVTALLKEKGLAVNSEGALVVPLEDYGMPPALIERRDGASLYITRDLAAALYRKKTYNFDKCLYVVAYQQNLHFKQLFKVLELMGYDWAGDCVHLAFGMVSLPGGVAIKSRTGNVIFLNDVFNAAVSRAQSVMSGRALDAKQKTAEQVGVGAVVFDALYNNKIKDTVFDLDSALNFDGETGPYIQYTHARCCSVLNKAGEYSTNDYSALYDEDAVQVLKDLTSFNETVRLAALRYEPYLVARYLVKLSQDFNRFYVNNRIITEDKTVSAARLALTEKVRDTLKAGLELVLLSAPEAM